jgi:superfamily I DNA/RNA helicase
MRVDMAKLLSFARAFLVADIAALEGLALDRCLGPDAGGAAWEYFMDVADDAMRLLADPNRKIIDYDDQIWLPVYHGLRVAQYDVVYVDEAQDLSPAKFALARMAVKPGGVLVIVGDDRQAIYGFAGADPNSLPAIIEETQAKVLPLTVTYRCPKAVVALAQGLVGDYTAHESAPEGLVSRIAEGEILARLVPGDTVVSRSNAPIVSLCLRLLASGMSAKVLGKNDVAEAIKKLVLKSKAREVSDLLSWVSDWSEREMAKLVKAGKNCDVVADKRDCVFALAEGVFSVDELIARIDRLFTDAIEGRVVLLTSTHKAKGLEWDRVFLLQDTYRADCSSDPQEANLLYVGITRAKRELVLVSAVKAPL